MSFQYKREMMIKIAMEFSKRVNLPFKLGTYNEEEAIIIVDCQDALKNCLKNGL